jgi:hypothetical protein
MDLTDGSFWGKLAYPDGPPAREGKKIKRIKK